MNKITLKKLIKEIVSGIHDEISDAPENLKQALEMSGYRISPVVPPTNTLSKMKIWEGIIGDSDIDVTVYYEITGMPSRATLTDPSTSLQISIYAVLARNDNENFWLDVDSMTEEQQDYIADKIVNDIQR